MTLTLSVAYTWCTHMRAPIQIPYKCPPFSVPHYLALTVAMHAVSKQTYVIMSTYSVRRRFEDENVMTELDTAQLHAH